MFLWLQGNSCQEKHFHIRHCGGSVGKIKQKIKEEAAAKIFTSAKIITLYIRIPQSMLSHGTEGAILNKAKQETCPNVKVLVVFIFYVAHIYIDRLMEN